ncbi:MAG TPA: response regulator [Calditrichae bacterium]|nr:response regulator [Calditrichia bacterium]
MEGATTYRILVVDDDYASRILLNKVLEQDGYRVTTASDGSEALELLRRETYDVVISDLIMEHVGGLELLKQIKEGGIEVAVILLTGHASIETAIEAVRLGASDYLMKPVNTEELKVRLRKTIERVELERRLKEAERQLTYQATIATANHEINQPLTVIISAIEMIRMELRRLGVDNKKIDTYLDLMTKSSQRIAAILRKLREITSPRIQELHLGMRMLELDASDAVPEGKHRNEQFILVIEDEENLRKIIRSVLESEQYNVISAETAREGIDLFRVDRNIIDLVILDVNLPDADGLMVLEEILKIDPRQKVVLTSGFDVEQAVQRGLQMGARGFLRKPFNAQELLETVRNITTMPD